MGVVGITLQLPLDAAGFSRRSCPRCGADFKVRWGRRDARGLAAALTARVEHLNRSEAAIAGGIRHCPYCAAIAASDAWWTAEQRAWIESAADGLAREIRWRRLRAPLERLADNPRPTYVPVPPEADPAAPPEDEGAAMVTLPLPCCGEEIAAARSWTGPIRCHFCGCIHARSAARDPWRELALLREWMSSR